MLGVSWLLFKIFYLEARTDFWWVWCLEVTEVSGCGGCITEDKIQSALKTVGTDKITGIYGLHHELYLRLSKMFVPLLETVYNNWMKRGSVSQRFTWGIVKFLRKNKQSGDAIRKFCPLTMLNTNEKILTKVLADRMLTALPALIGPGQCGAVKDRTIQDSFHLVRTIIEKVDVHDVLINIDQSKAFKSWPWFLGGCFFCGWIRLNFRSWIRLLYISPGYVAEANGMKSKTFTLSRSIHLGYILSAQLYVLVLEPFFCELRLNPILRGIISSGASTITRYSAYTDTDGVLETGSAEVLEISKEIGRCQEPKLIGGFAVWFVDKFCSSRLIQLDGRSVQDTRSLVWPQSPAGEKLVRGSGKGCGHYWRLVTKEALLKKHGLCTYPLLLYHLFYFLSRVPFQLFEKESSSSLLETNGLLSFVGRSFTFTPPKAAWEYRMTSYVAF